MKTKITMLLALLLALVCTAAYAQEYYTLPEIREQAAQGWHETYTDKYGRVRQVDIDIEVFGEEKAPVIKACWDDPYALLFQGEKDPYGEITEEVDKGRGEYVFLYSSVRGMTVDLDQKYGEAYGNDLTPREVYAFIEQCLQERGIDQDYIWERPYTFSLVYGQHKKSGEVLVPPVYYIWLWPQEQGLPIMEHVGSAFQRDIDVPYTAPYLQIWMRDRENYSCAVIDFDVQEVLAEDIPLCAVDKVIEGARKMIEDGHICQVLSLRFGYVVYTDPDYQWKRGETAYDMPAGYLVPSWILECYILNNPKVDKLSEYAGVATLVINAQTGEMLDWFDTSYHGRGDGRYKGFIPWDKVK